MWVRAVPLTESQTQRLRTNQIKGGQIGRIKGAQKNHALRLAREQSASDEANETFSQISRDQLFFVGLGLYWGEGTKSESSKQVSITNSDPRVIQTMIRWFTECLNIEPERFHPRIFISDVHRDREETLLAFWEKTLNVPRIQFNRTIFLPKGKKIYENHDMYYGVLTLRIARGGDVRNKILASIARIAELTAIMPV